MESGKLSELESFALAVKTLRWYWGFDQGEIAERVGVSAATVSRWEGGKMWPSVPHLLKLMEVLKGTPDQFLAFEPLGL